MLTSRYNIPIENISFEHISQLKANKNSERELEKIIKILESGELGYFPELLQHSQEKLKQINHHHRLLREPPTIVQKLQSLEQDQAERLKLDLNEWVKEMKNKETIVETTESDQCKTQNLNIRSHISTSQAISTKASRIKSCDYDAWDKFDPDVEMKKMDVEVEREKTKIRRRALEKEKKVDETKYLTSQEKVKYAEDLRIKGNEAYKAGNLLEAIKRYTESIQLYPTAVTYSNRAQVYIKISKTKDAIEDCNKALSIDPHFVKAIYRKALTLYNTKKYAESVKWFEKFLKEEPDNKTAHNYLTKLHSFVPVKLLKNPNEKYATQNKQAKIVLIDEDVQQNIQYIKDDAKQKIRKENFEKIKTLPGARNEWGLLKKQPIPRGQPKFMKEYDTYQRDRYRMRLEANKTSVSNIGNIDSTQKQNSSNKANEVHGKSLKSITERHPSQFLDAPEEYKPKAIVDIFGTNSTRKLGMDISPQIHMMPKPSRDETSQRPKIEVLKSVDFKN